MLLPRDKEDKSADVEAFTQLTAVRYSVTHSTNFFLLSTSNLVTGQNVTRKVMTYTIRTFRGYSKTSSFKEALDNAENQVEAIAAEGWSLAMQWAEITNFVGGVKLVYRNADGTIGETPWRAFCKVCN